MRKRGISEEKILQQRTSEQYQVKEMAKGGFIMERHAFAMEVKQGKMNDYRRKLGEI